MAIDTYANIEELKKAGIPENQAVVIVEQQKKLIEKDLVTKEYLNARLLKLEIRLITWQIGVALVLGGFLYAVLH